MNTNDMEKLAGHIVNMFKSNTIIPAKLFSGISELLSDDPKSSNLVFKKYWDNASFSSDIKIDTPLAITRGFDKSKTTEAQLATYLPEEKIIINKDIFRKIIKDENLVNLDARSQEALIDRLFKESIGLTKNDVLLYFNLIKVNQLANSGNGGSKSPVNSKEAALEIYNKIFQRLNINEITVKRVNGGREIKKDEVLKSLNSRISQVKLNPDVMLLFLGNKNSKFINFFIDFLSFIIKQRGDKEEELFVYFGLYILLGGTSTQEQSKMNLSSHVEAFVNDRIGRVRSIFYVALKFIYTYNLVLTTQVFEISSKYFGSNTDQKLKLEKLYKADSRRALLINNSLNIAQQRIAGHKSESIEVLSAFKRFYNQSKLSITSKDLFNYNYGSQE